MFGPDIRLIVVSITIVLLVVGRCLLNFAYVGLLAWAGTRVTHDLRVKLFQRFLAVDYLSISRDTQGRQINALDGSCYRVGQAVMDYLLMVVNGCTDAGVRHPPRPDLLADDGDHVGGRAGRGPWSPGRS